VASFSSGSMLARRIAAVTPVRSRRDFRVLSVRLELHDRPAARFEPRAIGVIGLGRGLGCPRISSCAMAPPLHVHPPVRTNANLPPGLWFHWGTVVRGGDARTTQPLRLARRCSEHTPRARYAFTQKQSHLCRPCWLLSTLSRPPARPKAVVEIHGSSRSEREERWPHGEFITGSVR